MTAKAQLQEDGPPNVEPRVYTYGLDRNVRTPGLAGCKLAFAGGTVDTASFVESHNGPTPTTVMKLTPEQREAVRRDLCVDELTDAAAFIEDAKKLIGQGRYDEARFELNSARRHIENAVLWCEPFTPAPAEVRYIDDGVSDG